MARYLFDRAEPVSILFVNFAKTEADLLFRDELESMARRWRGLRLRWIVEDDSASNWTGHVGRPSRDLLRALSADLPAADLFCCGPAPFMAAVRDAVETLAGSLQRYREVSFQPAAEAPASVRAPTTPTSPASGSAEVRFVRAAKKASVERSATLLTAAGSVGLNIPYACQMGLCGTCKVKKVSGDVKIDHQGGITDAEIAAGYVLASCSRAPGDFVELDL